MNQPDHSEILVHVFGRTDVGRTREHNEDAFVVADLTTNDASLQPSVRTHRVGEKARSSWSPTAWAARPPARSRARLRTETCSKNHGRTCRRPDIRRTEPL